MNPYAIPPLITSILALFLGILTFRSVNPKVRYTFPLVSVAVFIWLFGYFLVYSATEYEVALRWIKLLYIGVIFIPAVSYHFTVAFLSLKGKTKLIIATYLITVGFVMLSRNESFIAGAYKYFWGYQTKVGPLHNIFLVFFSLVMVRVIVLLFLQYRAKRKTSPLEANRIKYVLISFSASTFAILDFLPNYGIERYPLGFLCITFYAICITYAIVRYRVLDINVAITRAGIFTLVYLVVLGLPFGIGYRLLGKGLWLIPLLIGIILASGGPFIYSIIRQRAEERLRREEFLAHQALNKLAQNMMRFTKLQTLLKLIAHYVVKIMKVDFAAIYLRAEGNKHYHLSAIWSINNTSPEQTEFLEESSLVKDILLRTVPIVSEELSLGHTSKVSAHLKTVQRELQKSKAAVIIPAFKGDYLFGFLMLGTRRDNRVFSQEDLNLLMLLASQSVLAIENAQLFEKEKTFLAEKSRRDALADMAPGVAHQFNNRLVSISMRAEMQKAQLEQKDIKKLDPELASLINETKDSLDAIVKDALKGKDIANAILKKGKAKLAYIKTDLAPIIQSSIDLLNMSRTQGSLKGAQEPEIIILAKKNLPKLTLNESLIQDIFYNLIDNARDAVIMKNKAINENKITPEMTPFKGKVTIALAKKDNKVIATVNDNGIGMDEKTKTRLFVPYFTTKGTALKGTGMGLWVIRSFIEDHKGKISFESEYAKGATFTVTFPIKEALHR